MPKSANQKLKLYYLFKILTEETDESHSITMPEIIKKLDGYGIHADRKSIYDDMEALRQTGLDVIGERDGRGFKYFVGSKNFDLAELKLLVDNIQASKFITERKSRALIAKIEKLGSRYEAEELHRQVKVFGRVKTMNESIYYNVDALHKAISSDCQIEFKYLTWDMNKKLVPRKESLYRVSPWGLIWSDENYYLVAYDEKADLIKHYRVDKMKNISRRKDKRLGKEAYENVDTAAYTKMNFSMFSGEKKKVQLQFKKSAVGILLDRFGTDIPLRSLDDEYGETVTDVFVSGQFFGWILSLGDGVRLVGPEDVVEEYKKYLKDELAGL